MLHRVLLDPSMGHVSKSVLTETFDSEDWQNQSVPLEPTNDDQSGAMVPSMETPKTTDIEITDEMVVNHPLTEKENKWCENDIGLALERLDELCSQKQLF